MSSAASKFSSALGFLTVVDHPQHGLVGGYLVLNGAGRPIEFHCTAPIKPNRAQEILYGPTLEPYLFGEQIGQTLLRKAQTEPLVVCTDRRPVLAVRDHCTTPVALVLPQSDIPKEGASNASPPIPDGSERTWRLDSAHSDARQLSPFALGRNRLAVRADWSDDQPTILQRLGVLEGSFDLLEPFDRIREAIEEARRGG